MRAVVVLAYATAGLGNAMQWVAGKVGLAVAPPLELSTVRFAIGSVVLVAVALVVRAPWPLHRWRPVAAASALGFLGFNALSFAGLRLTPAADGALIVPTMIPVATALLATLIGEPLTRRKALGFAIATAGTAVVVLGGQELATGISPSRLIGDLLLVAGAFAWGACLTVSRLVVRTEPPAGFLAMACVLGTLMLLPFGFLEHGYRDLPTWPAETWRAALVLGVISTGVSFSIFFWAVRRFGAGLAALVGYVTPIAGIALAFLVLAERPEPLQLVGAAVTLSGVRLITGTGAARR